MSAEDIKGWMTAEELAWLRTIASSCGVIVEFGSWKGRSTLALCESTKGVVFAVDHFQGSAAELATHHAELSTREGQAQVKKEFLFNLDLHIRNGRLFLLQGRTGDADEVLGPILAHRKADMVFIDADHAEEAVLDDFRCGWSLLRPGGILCGHDYDDPNWPGVTKAVDRLGGSIQRGADSLWYLFKDGDLPPGDR